MKRNSNNINIYSNGNRHRILQMNGNTFKSPKDQVHKVAHRDVSLFKLRGTKSLSKGKSKPLTRISSHLISRFNT